MFKKNLYSFCALIALTCAANAMEDEPKSSRSALRASTASLSIDDQEPAEASQSSPASSTPSAFFPNDEEKVTFTWAALEQAGSFQNPNPDPRAKALRGFLMEMFFSEMKPGVHYELPLLPTQLDGNIWDLCQYKELIGQIRKAIDEANASSPASSTPSSFFPNNDENVTFTWPALKQAGGFENPNPDPRANALYSFLKEIYTHENVVWDSDKIYELPLLQRQLDGCIWDLCNDKELVRKIGKAINAYPTTQKVISRLSEVQGWPAQDLSEPKERRRKLRALALILADRLEDSKAQVDLKEQAEKQLMGELETSKAQVLAKEEAEKQLTSQLTALEADLEASKAQVVLKEEAEKQLTSQLKAQGEELEASRAQTAAKAQEAEELTSQFAALRAEFEAFKAQSQNAAEGFAATLAAKNAHTDLLQSAISDVQATFVAAAERLAALPTQASE